MSERWQLVRVVHDRCGEYDGTEYVLAPPDWQRSKIADAINKVRDEMVADAQAVKESPLAPPHQPPYEKFLDKSVREVKLKHEGDQARYNVWKRENAHLTRSFRDRLVEVGFARIYEDEADVVQVKAVWAHNHSLNLNYERAKI